MPAPPPRSQPLRKTAFDNRRLARAGIEVMTLEALWQRVPRSVMVRAERIDFFMLMLIDGGRGTHMVDFVQFPLQAGSLVFVQPGQVQQWHPRPGLRGQMLMVAPPAMNPDIGRSALKHTLAAQWPEWPVATALAGKTRALFHQALDQLADECAAFDDSHLSTALMRGMLTTLLLRLARLHARSSDAAPVPHAGADSLARLLRTALEARLHERPTVQSLASVLGYSVSTLNRACLATQGRSAKAVIDRRVALEAQRLLVHSRDAAAHVGTTLGFSEPTNFLKFFKRVVGCTPEVFRQRYGTA